MRGCIGSTRTICGKDKKITRSATDFLIQYDKVIKIDKVMLALQLIGCK